MKFQYITHKVSFILCVELQLATQLYNSVIRCDLLNGNSYAWSEKGKKGSGFIGHLGGQIIHREQIFTGWDHRPLLLNKLVINSLDDLEQISFPLRTSVPSKEFEKDHWQKSIRVLYRKFVRGKVVDNLKAYSCDHFNLYSTWCSIRLPWTSNSGYTFLTPAKAHTSNWLTRLSIPLLLWIILLVNNWA